MTSEPLVCRTDIDGLSHLTLNRPEKLNALNPSVFKELRSHLEAVAADDTIGCVVLSGAGPSFCAGHDLEAIGAAGGIDEIFAAETIDLLEAIPKPTIAKIHGHCLTGALELALACDLLVAAETAQFADTHGQWGLIPVWGMSIRLPERIGRSRAKELMFTSRRIGGPEAAQIGLVDYCVPDDALDRYVEHLAGEILANSWGTNWIAKALLASGANRTRLQALQFEREAPFGAATQDSAARMAQWQSRPRAKPA